MLPETALAEAHARWPGVAVDDDAFAAFVEQKRGGRPLERLHLGELYLAFGCAQGDAAALRHFEQAFFSRLEADMARVRVGGDVDDLKQLLRSRFFVGLKGEAPAILQYSGEGALGGWVQVSVMRELLKFKERQGREAALDDDALPGALVTHDGPELAHLRHQYRDAFAQAFRDALAALEPDERLLLRHHYLDGLSIDELGRLQRIHRSTAARKVVKAREALFEGTRALLRERLGLGADELESLIRDVRSQLDLTLRLLKEAPAPER